MESVASVEKGAARRTAAPENFGLELYILARGTRADTLIFHSNASIAAAEGGVKARLAQRVLFMQTGLLRRVCRATPRHARAAGPINFVIMLLLLLLT